MNLSRDDMGFIDLNNDEIKFLELDTFKKNLKFEYLNEIYYYKKIDKVDSIYNELIASEIAKDYKIDCVSYDIATYDDTIGVISKNFIDESEKYISMGEIIRSVFDDKFLDKRNNLYDIWYALDIYYKDLELTKKLMDQIINMFIFDILIGNIDRHFFNYGIIENKNSINIAPLFDNEKMLDDNSIYYGDYCIGIDENDYSIFPDELEIYDNIIYKFINESSSYYKELLEDKLKIITDENVNKIICSVEERIKTKIPHQFKRKIMTNFDQNLKMINNVLTITKKSKIYQIH